ncbi:hypothetical protein MLD38_034609 [Melastoma candidum]|uniref:Uncharacterized protein n=1 Tax=Melastoma candidum TaxID=119954 RepID=A0ACB9MCJ0_9MYRT|nr:hypothetical protein MLD38_034609 [Melastoma candidum]
MGEEGEVVMDLGSGGSSDGDRRNHPPPGEAQGSDLPPGLHQPNLPKAEPPGDGLGASADHPRRQLVPPPLTPRPAGRAGAGPPRGGFRGGRGEEGDVTGGEGGHSRGSKGSVVGPQVQGARGQSRDVDPLLLDAVDQVHVDSP